MGLLDDAIREHLELQRRRGADPAEIERSEREALGPVRRAPEELEPAEFDPHGDEPAEFDAQGDEPAEFDHLAGADHADEYEYEYEEGPEHEAAYPEESHETQVYEAEPPEYEPPGHEPLSHENEPESPMPHPAPESGHLGQETVEYEFDDHPEAGERPEAGEHLVSGEHPEAGEHLEDEHPDAEHREGEDVLEETPEFLQDTPEHDRLWFEQRPPRDFDFDG
jgi:hypothetical protein